MAQKERRNEQGGADRRQRLFSHKVADDHRIRRVVKLLKKGSEQNRKEKDQQLFPDHTFRDLVSLIVCLHSHICISPTFPSISAITVSPA